MWTTGPFEVDGRWFCSNGEVRVENSNNNLIEAYGTDGLEDCIVRRGFRGDTYVAEFDFTWNNDSSPGWLVRWLTPGDYLAIDIQADDDKPRLWKREDDGVRTLLATASTGLSLSSSTTYTAKVVITESGVAQSLDFYVDLNGPSEDKR